MRPLLTLDDTILSATKKLAQGNSEAQTITLLMLKRLPVNASYFLVLDMDDMQMYGAKIVEAYHGWSKNDYDRLIVAIRDRDPRLLAFLTRVKVAGAPKPALVGGKWASMTTAQIIAAEGGISRAEFQKRKQAGNYKE